MDGCEIECILFITAKYICTALAHFIMRLHTNFRQLLKAKTNVKSLLGVEPEPATLKANTLSIVPPGAQLKIEGKYLI